MIVKLVRHGFPDMPEWRFIKEEVPIGTEYEVLGYDTNITIYNKTLGLSRKIDAYLVRRIDKNDSGPGFLPTVVFEPGD